MITYVFPGQGSQSKGMGGELFDEFKELTAKADSILGYSIKQLCLEDTNGNLGQTQFTQPALYVVNVLSYQKRVAETGKKPDYVAGHSLGEYNALYAAGAFDFETGLELVKKRGELMSRATGGGMAAVVGLAPEQIVDVLQQNNLQNVEMANFNSPTQIVISGLKTEIEKAKDIFEAVKGMAMFIPLKTSGAFHSRYMSAAKAEFANFLETYKFFNLTIPVISNVHARPYRSSSTKQNLIDQITSPVKWTESIRYLMGRGEMEFEEIGPGNVLSGLVRRIKREAEPLVIEDSGIDDCIMEQKVECKESFINNNQSLQVQEESSVQVADKGATPGALFFITPESLGSSQFKKDYNLKYAYLTGGMYRAVASKEMVVKIGKAGMMGFFGTGGLDLFQIKDGIKYIQTELDAGQAYGMSLVHNMADQEMEERTIDLFLETGVKHIEAAAFLNVTPALVKYRAQGIVRDRQGKPITSNKIIAKISRPEVAAAFLTPAPERIVAKLLAESKITQEQAGLLKEIPMADDICVEADSGGHTDGGVAYALMPAMIKLRDEMMVKYRYYKEVRVGAAGGIGTPEAAAAAFILGADFILTGSINQCTVEAGTSNIVKDLLQQMNIQDTEYVPAGDMFELGAKVQVLKKGLFFPARANKLYDLYRQYNSLDDIDEKTKKQLQEKYFRKSFEKIYEDAKAFYPAHEIERAERNPKHKMSLIFRWYFGYSSRLALSGSEESKVDYQIYCGPALGAFNQWVKGTELENWRKRHVDEIGKKLIIETAELINHRLKNIVG
ncbi:MAG TPA: ACP S-malonyltransferase [Methylomusa anaerophila]|uniref:[acyl-carrier-protein] S-malonyltransferase n=1 Tax=Methylomusa anaerophila TaxID=1930071 RepID=A0A348AN85_9FIRM|nr:ACP S-malonyltransferase [Methylomusa anaerophila]BBB92533.1 polyketide biosynthesis protein PksE [Methylomusa anaerophila]HML87612.1 ACP S-malonyltransferase [Methylomusa anaerophila]